MDTDDLEMDNDFLLGVENKSEEVVRGDSQRLKFALKKRQIVEEERGRLHRVVQDIRMKEKLSGVQLKLLEDDPFVKFYLEIYRDLCGRRNIEEITKEVFRRWNNMKRKPRITLRKIHMDPHVTFGLAWDMAFGENQSSDKNQLKFALMKNRIVMEEITRLANFIRNMYKEKKCSVMFLKTYLKVFRELCGKSSMGEIRGEAMRRYINSKQSKSNSKAELKKKTKCKKLLRSESRKMRKPHEFLTHGVRGRDGDFSTAQERCCGANRSSAL